MAGLTGADVEQLDALAARFEASSRRIADLTSRASAMIATAAWTGADIDELRSNWNRQAKPGLAVSSSALTTLSLALKKQAAEQRTTSAAGVSGSVSGGAGTGTTPGTGGAPSVGDGSNYYKAGLALGPGFLIGSAGAYAMAGAKGSSSGSATSGPFSAGWGSSGFAGAEAGGKAGVDIGTDHIKANESVDARAGAGGTATASAGIAGIGSVTGTAQGFAGAEVHQSGELSLDKNGLKLGDDVHAYAGATGSASVSNTIGGITNTTTIDGFAGARVGADAALNVGPHSVGAKFGFDALAGAEVKATQSSSGGGWSESASISAKAGAGIDLSDNGFEASYEKVGVNLNVGAALGLGAGLSVDVSVSPKYYVDKISSMFGF